ncbi:MAG: hypothetical protein ABSE69_20940 [Roseiarcus sp.]|jgi:predicted DNA-binding transcriptional regulator AlpA
MQGELEPNILIRKCDGHKYFGLKRTQIDEHIKAGNIPAPVSLSDSGRAKAWFGFQINEYHRRLRAQLLNKGAA